jgi:hypothetical protein
MPAKKMTCTFCNHKFWACRSDSLYCSKKCRAKERRETIKFITQPWRSGIAGITWNRSNSRWMVKVKVEGKWKYVGSFRDFGKARMFQLEVINGNKIAREAEKVAIASIN